MKAGPSSARTRVGSPGAQQLGSARDCRHDHWVAGAYGSHAGSGIHTAPSGQQYVAV